MPKGCPVIDEHGECINAKDKEMGDGFCTDHSYAWRRSEEFRAAMRDESVLFVAGLRIPSMLRSALRPFKKKWLKRIAAETEN